MSAKNFRVPSATANPLNHAANRLRLPRSRPTIEFPVVTHAPDADRAHAALMLLGLLGCCLARTLLSLIRPLEHAMTYFLPLFLAGYVLLGLFGAALRRLNAARGSTGPGPRRILFIVSIAAMASVLLAQLPFVTTPIALFALVLNGWQFRRHYVHRATAGMLDAKTIENFRRHGRLPTGLRPRSSLAGFRDAVVSYLTYNRAEVDAPGVLQSPAGSYTRRIAGVFILVLLLNATMHSWLAEMPPAGLPAGSAATELLPFPSVLVAAAAPVGLWFAAALLFVGGIAGKAYALRCAQMSVNHLRRLVDRMRSSVDKIERESILLGLVEADGSPILYHIGRFLRHVWLCGKTGSGKTAFLMLNLYQLIYRGDYSVIVIDMKSVTFELLACLQDAAAKASRSFKRPIPVKYFTLENGDSTYLFNIFEQSWWKSLVPAQRAAVVLSALSLIYARIYGRSYYTDACYEFMHYVLERYPDVRSWIELRRRMQDTVRHARSWELSDSAKRDGEHAMFIVNRLAAIPSLNDYGQHPKAVLDGAIDFTDAFSTPRHFYFGLGAVRNPLIAGEVGRLVVAAVLNAAYVAKRKRSPMKVILAIDEAQELTTEHLDTILSKARAFGVGVILCNQHTGQLVTPDYDLRPIVESASLQAWFQVPDAIGREQLGRLGGQQIIELESRHEHYGDDSRTTRSYTEHLVDRVPPTLISEVNADDSRFFIRLTENAGYACYGDLIFTARSVFHQSKKAYEACCAMPWPAPTPNTVVNGPLPPAVLHPPHPAASPPGGGAPPMASPHGRTRQLGRRRPLPGTP